MGSEFRNIQGAPGIHFHCLNQFEPVRTIWKHVAQP